MLKQLLANWAEALRTMKMRTDPNNTNHEVHALSTIVHDAALAAATELAKALEGGAAPEAGATLTMPDAIKKIVEEVVAAAAKEAMKAALPDLDALIGRIENLEAAHASTAAVAVAAHEGVLAIAQAPAIQADVKVTAASQEAQAAAANSASALVQPAPPGA